MSSNSKASLCSDFKTNPNSCEKIQAVNICHFTAKALAIHHGMEQREWHVENITWQLGDSLHRSLANGNCPWLGESGNSNEYNVCKTDSPYFQRLSPRLRVVPHFSSGLVGRAKRELAWKSPHATKGDTRRGERKMRDYRQSPSFWPFTADWFWSAKFVSPSKSIKRIQWHSFPYWAVIALVIGKLRGIFIIIASKRKPRY